MSGPFLRTWFSTALRLCGATLLLLAASTGLASADPLPGWERRLKTELARIDAGSRADIGVYVRDIDTGQAAAWKADHPWYLASTVKLPVALAVLGNVQRGVFALDTPVALRASDYVDGAGPTNGRPVGAQPSVGWLLQQMMIHSDNTATDMLIGLVGLNQVNALVLSLVPAGFEPITTLADVRRNIYGQLTPAAARLSGHDFLLLKQQRGDVDRRRMLARLLQVQVLDFKLPTVRDAYDAYYATGLNSARLDAYGELLAQVVQGKVLDARHTADLLALMERSRTGHDRIKAGLPPDVRWAHKTGTQSARTCDSGVITVPATPPRAGRDQRVVVAACTRGEFSVTGADRVLRQVGAAICRSGLLGAARPHHDPTVCAAEPAHSAPFPASLPGTDASTDADADADPAAR